MSDQSDGSERRQFHRVPFAGTAHLSVAGQEIAGPLIDLSLKGALMEIGAAPAPEGGARGTLRVLLSDDASIAMEVSVAWQREGWLGLHCDHIDLESVQHLRRLVELNLGDDALLNRDLAALADGEA
jgi:hypothetical protein